MAVKDTFAAFKKKGFKFNFLKIPTRATPQKIEHNMREEMDRARVIRALTKMQEFLDNTPTFLPLDRELEIHTLTVEISALIEQLKAYKK